jgi:carboxyl-terminal processing protease
MMIPATAQDDIRRTLDALICQLGDPHTWFVPERGARQFPRLLAGESATLPGFTLHRGGGGFVVGETLPGSPAEAAGLKLGDEVRSIAGVPVTLGMRDAFRVMNHEVGSVLQLEVVRRGSALRLALVVTEWHLPLTELRLLEAGVAYLRLRLVATSERPEADAGARVGRALAEIADAGLRKLVLDLRSNPGGYGVTRVASHFTRADPLLFYQGPSGQDEPARSSGYERIFEGRVVVLVDDQTLSAAEMITLALRECAEAKVVGQPTAGGLNVPRRLFFPNGDLLMVPERLALGARSRACPAGMRIAPDILSPNRTPADFATGRDPQLETACEALAS